MSVLQEKGYRDNPFDRIVQSCLDIARLGMFFNGRYRDGSSLSVEDISELEEKMKSIRADVDVLNKLDDVDIELLRRESYMVRKDLISNWNSKIFSLEEAIPTTNSKDHPFTTVNTETLLYDEKTQAHNKFLREISGKFNVDTLYLGIDAIEHGFDTASKDFEWSDLEKSSVKRLLSYNVTIDDLNYMIAYRTKDAKTRFVF